MTIKRALENLSKGDKIHHKFQQLIYLKSPGRTFLVIIDFLIALCFSTVIDTLHKFCSNSLSSSTHIWMILKNHLISATKVIKQNRFSMQSIIYLLLATRDSGYLYFFLWILHHFTIYFHKRSMAYDVLLAYSPLYLKPSRNADMISVSLAWHQYRHSYEQAVTFLR